MTTAKRGSVPASRFARRMLRSASMRLACGIAIALAIACTEHDPELTRVGGPEQDTSSDASVPEENVGASDDVRWCQAFLVLETVCQRCHTDPTLNGAPVPLLTYEDT